MVNTIFRKDLFAGKVALVTGGGTGIGARAARELAWLGATVVVAGRTMESLEKTASQIGQEGGNAYAIICNIREEESITACIEQTLERAGGLDLLINNAGGQFPSPAEYINRKGWHAVIDTNLTGTFFLTQEVFKRVFAKNGGAVVNVIANMWNGFPMMSHTGAARAAVENLTRTLATEWGRYGVRINSVAPGVINSSGLEKYGPEVKPFIEAAHKHNQTFRLGTEEEVAAAIAFLLSPAAAFITGETLKVDGAESLYHPFYPPIAHEGIPPYQDEEPAPSET